MSFSFKKKGKKWTMTGEVLNGIRSTIGARKPEWGGILGSTDGIHIDRYYFDSTALRTGCSYTMDTDALNRVIHKWNDEGIRFIGVIHSHPNGATSPSGGDLRLAERIIETMDVGGELFTPIVQVSPELNGNIRIYPYTVSRSVKLHNQPLIFEKGKVKSNVYEAENKAAAHFSRLSSALPFHIMRKKAVICIGCGGSRNFLLSLARCGVSEFYLFDGDKVEASNIATQGAFSSEIGKLKAEVIKKQLLDINPAAHICCFPEFLDDSLSDRDFAQRTELDRHAPEDIILCGCTDNAKAQLRCELLSRKFEIPYLGAQIYPKGKGHEVVFTYPGLTESCCMCMLKTRYKKIFSESLSHGGSSEGTAVWVTDNLNSLKTYLALCILCYKEKETDYYGILKTYAERNYFMTRCREEFIPSAFEPIGRLLKEEGELSLPVGTLAIEQTPEKDCPVCGATLSNLTGDTVKALQNIIKGFRESKTV